MLFGASGDSSHGAQPTGCLGGVWKAGWKVEAGATICCCCGDTDRKGTGRSLLSLRTCQSYVIALT